MKGIEWVGSVIKSLAESKEAIGTKMIVRVGSDVTANDSNYTFQFMSFAYIRAPGMLYWTSERREQFENAAKDLLLSRYVDMFMNFANDPKIIEVKDVQPPLERFFDELLPLAYPTRDIRDLRVGRIEHIDAQITDCRSQNIFIFNGIIDLSIIYTPLEVSLGGGEIKLSKSELAIGPDLNSVGKRGVAQTGTQIFRAVKKLRKLIVNAHHSLC